MNHILALDQGTTSSRALVFDLQGRVVAMAQRELRQHYPQPGQVEHDAAVIWRDTLACAHEALQHAALSAADIAAIGITSQRETVVLWDRATGQPLAPVEQHLRELCHQVGVRNDGLQEQHDLLLSLFDLLLQNISELIDGGSWLQGQIGAIPQLLTGTLDQIKEMPFGRMIVGLTGPDESVAAALAYLKEKDLKEEVIGYAKRHD